MLFYFTCNTYDTQSVLTQKAIIVPMRIYYRYSWNSDIRFSSSTINKRVAISINPVWRIPDDLCLDGPMFTGRLSFNYQLAALEWPRRVPLLHQYNSAIRQQPTAGRESRLCLLLADVPKHLKRLNQLRIIFHLSNVLNCYKYLWNPLIISADSRKKRFFGKRFN